MRRVLDNMTTEFLERIEAGEGTAQDAAQALHAAMNGQSVESDSTQPEPAAAKDEGALPADLTPENAVIASKNGLYTIPFEQLERSRHSTAQAQARVAELEAQLQAAQANQNAGAAPTQAENIAQAAVDAIEQGVDPGLFGDFSEADLAKGIQRLVMMNVEKATESLRGELAPLRAQQALSVTDAHFSSIYAAHPDADSITESAELAGWIGKQPSVAQAAYQSVLERGTAAQVVELFDAFKKDTGTATQIADASLTAKAREAVAKAQTTVPSSISDIPGGRMGATNYLDAIDSMTPAAAMAAVQALSPEQREQYMNRVA
jgi:hypothetical protein